MDFLKNLVQLTLLEVVEFTWWEEFRVIKYIKILNLNSEVLGILVRFKEYFISILGTKWEKLEVSKHSAY